MMADEHDGNPPQSAPDGRRQARSFILRVWLESRSDGPPELRGSLADLGGRVLGAFASLEALGRLVHDQLFGGRR
jgi:hypothetical protein